MEDKKIILFVDDEASQRQLITMNAEVYDASFSVDTAASGGEAIDLINSKKYDAVVIDILLPDMMGGMLGGIIRKFHPEMPIAFLTGFDSKTAEKLAGEINAEFWRKDDKADFEELARCIEQLIKGFSCDGEANVPKGGDSGSKIELPSAVAEMLKR